MLDSPNRRRSIPLAGTSTYEGAFSARNRPRGARGFFATGQEMDPIADKARGPNRNRTRRAPPYMPFWFPRGIEMTKENRILAAIVGALLLALGVATWASHHRNAPVVKDPALPADRPPMVPLVSRPPTTASTSQSTVRPADQPFYEPGPPPSSQPSPPQPSPAPEKPAIPEISNTVDGEASTAETEQSVTAPQQETAAQRVGRRLRHR
jgi:hypothetical protein